MLTKLLVANRGEIAVRVIQAAATLGLDTVAVHPDDDAQSAHVFKATEARRLDGEGARAYLDIDQLVRIARATGCDAVHPGYGFLSENARFAEACAREGIRFVGPRPETLRLFGDKAAARAYAQSLGVPVLAGTAAPATVEDAEQLFAALGRDAAVMVKAVAGGGGRGMREVTRATDLAEAFRRCRSEAASAFGDGTMFVEELLTGARHIEVQIVGDGADVIHLWERDCSVQRNRQKLIEIAPAPLLEPDVRGAILDAAVRITKSACYDGIGTVEFLVAGSPRTSPPYVFLEVNPRVQVEHTITEEIVGIDLVATQLRLASGATIAELGLDRLTSHRPRGMALQVRVNAETPQADGTVLPATGKLARFEQPTGRGVRVDTHAYAGYEVTARYDSLLAKVVVSDADGDLTALARRAALALRELDVTGVPTNHSLLHAILDHDAFRAGGVPTTFVDEHWAELLASPQPRSLTALITEQAAPTTRHASPDATLVPEGAVAVVSPLQGTVIEVAVDEGDTVPAGDAVVVLESMKMEHPVAATVGGMLQRMLVAKGDLVQEGTVLALLVDVGGADGAVSASRARDPDEIRPDLAEVIERHGLGLDDRREEAVARRHATGQRTARENIDDLCDAGSFVEYGALTIAGQRRRRTLDDLIRNTPADGMVTGIGSVGGVRTVVMSYDYMVLAGTQGLQNHKKTDRLVAVAERHGLPVVLFAEGGGGRPGDTDTFAVASLDLPTFEAFARLSGTVPVVGIVAGYCFAGNAALAACCDVIIATEGSNLGMGGPAMIRAGGLGDVAAKDIGPMSMQGPNGVIDVVVADEADAVAAAKKYLSYFGGRVAEWSCADQRPLRHMVPENRLRAYDVRPIIETIADVDSVLELRAQFGVGIITALARVEGRPVGVLANNTRHLAGAIDADGADKASRFVHLCDEFDLPVVSLCDTPGFMVGNEAERTASIRHFGRMFVAGANADVPMCMVILRKAYGLGPVAMAGGGLKAPMYTVAWPTGEFGGMALEGAVALGYRRELDAIEDAEARRHRYEELVLEMYTRGKAVSAATAFEIDDVIDPADTRRVVAHALDTVATPRRPVTRGRYVDPW